MMPTCLRILAAAAVMVAGLGATHALADWRYEVKNDPFTDKRIASWIRGRAMLDGQEYQIVYECQASTGAAFVLPAREGLSEIEVQYRVNRNPAHKGVWRQLSPRSPEFRVEPSDWQAILKESDPSSDLVLSAETTDAIMSGERRILHFDMRDFRAGVEKVDADCKNRR